jgi:hypothetical protein
MHMNLLQDQDFGLVILTSGPATLNRYYDLASPNYVQDPRLGSTFGVNAIRTIYAPNVSPGGPSLGQLLTYDCNAHFTDTDSSSTMERVAMATLWKAPTAGKFTFYAMLTGEHVGRQARVNAPMGQGSVAYFEYGYSHFAGQVLF